MYRVYYGMKERCYNQNCHAFEYYGGKGVKICDEWLNDFEVSDYTGRTNMIMTLDAEKKYLEDKALELLNASL